MWKVTCLCVYVPDLQWKPAHTEDTLTNMPRHSLYIIIGALCVAFVLMLIILIVGICRISRIEYQGSSRHAYQEFYNCRSIDSEFSNAIASIRHARSVMSFHRIDLLMPVLHSKSLLQTGCEKLIMQSFSAGLYCLSLASLNVLVFLLYLMWCCFTFSSQLLGN